MKGFYYQLKLTAKDKMSVISFILPLIMAAAVNILSQSDLSQIDSYRFALLKRDANNMPEFYEELSQYGIVNVYDTLDALEAAINEPENDCIGVVIKAEGDYGILLSGDERADIVEIAGLLPEIIKLDNSQYYINAIPQPNVINEFKNLFIGLVLVTALFLGLTFNTMNLVSEKEDGVIYIYDVLPLMRYKYLLQKIAIGYIGSVLLALLSAFICFENKEDILYLIPATLLCGFIAAVAGLFLGVHASTFMIALVYIKLVMLVFMAVPLLVYIYVPESIKPFFHIVPSYTYFDCVMRILSKNNFISGIFILFIQSISWLFLYWISQRKKRTDAKIL